MSLKDRASMSTDNSTPSSSEDTLEMEAMHAGPGRPSGEDRYEDAFGSDDEGHTALLGAEREDVEWPIAVERRLSAWAQVKDLVIETAPIFVLSTIGLLMTGEVLDHVSHWKAMTRIDELIIIIPVVLNLKGNLEMNLSARMGTAANMGELDDPRKRNSFIFGNLALLQVQAAVVSFVAACASFLLGVLLPRFESHTSPSSAASSRLAMSFMLSRRRPLPKLPGKGTHPKTGLAEFIMVASTAMTSTALSALLLGSFMCMLVVICRRLRLDPDNIAPPVAACLGDLVTLCLLGLVANNLIHFVNTPLPLILLILVVMTAITCAYFTHRNPHVRDLIKQGWSPLFGAMCISSSTGIMLDHFVSQYRGYAMLAIVIGGLPGGVGSVFVSRLSTTLHESVSAPQTLKETPHPSMRLTTIALLLITLPIEVLFLAIMKSIGWLDVPVVFMVMSVFFFCTAVLTSLLIARVLTNFLWSKGLDPDMYALPIHSSLMDLIGQSLLVGCFELAGAIGISVRQ